MAETFTPGFPAYLDGQRVGALRHERKRNVQREREAARSARAEGRLGYQQAPNEGRMVRFEGGPPARDGGRSLRWDAAGPGGNGGYGKGGRGRGGGHSANGYGRYWSGHGRGGSENPSF